MGDDYEVLDLIGMFKIAHPRKFKETVGRGAWCSVRDESLLVSQRGAAASPLR